MSGAAVAGVWEVWQDRRGREGLMSAGEARMIDYIAARQAMVDRQVRPSDVTAYAIISALLDVPREDFVPEPLKAVAYAGEHLDLGDGRVILDPWSFSKLLETVSIRKSDLVLDIGCALGYSTAVVARLAEAVIAVEENPDMAASAEETLAGHRVDNAVVQHGRLAEGAAQHGPYDVLLVQGGVGHFPPALAEQVKVGGRIAAIFAEGRHGQGRLGVRTPSGVAWRRVFDSTAPILPGFEQPKSFEF
jgi:protein-L-isoaspartate(D-aspartate) O-methyltransferase